MKKSPLSNLVGKSFSEIKRLRGLGIIGQGISSNTSRMAAMEERLQANNPEAPQNQPIAPATDEPFVAQAPNFGGVSNQSNDVGYNTGANYLEHQSLMSGLTKKGPTNPNVRTSTRRIGGDGIGGQD